MLKSTNNLIKGFILGISIMLPGLSGGTMAFIMGIYTQLLNEINKFKIANIKEFLYLLCQKKQVRKSWLFLKKTWDWDFLSPLILGLTLSMIIFTVLVAPLINKYSLPFYSLVFGLVLASLLKPFKKLKKTTKTFFLIGFSFFINFWLFSYGESLSLSLEDLSPFIFLLAGFLVSMALIIPGVSGSYLLLLLGLYEKTLFYLRELNIWVLFFFILGSIVGILLTAKGINYFLKKHFDSSIAIIIGLILASLYIIYPLPKESLRDILLFDQSKKVFLIFFSIGFIALWILSLLSQKINTKSTSL